jgi:phosphatidylinositol glycan class K
LNSEKRFLDFANGHGGDGYMKMQDTSYLLDFEMEKAIREMEVFSKYKEAFFIADSCSAITPYAQVKSKDTLILGSSKFNQKSYSFGKDSNLLISKTDK